MVVGTLRSTKIPVLGKQVALFDVSMTALGGYLIAEKMGWSKPKTILGMFVLGQVTHMALVLTTQFNDPSESSLPSVSVPDLEEG
jgi:hypothetical protein